MTEPSTIADTVAGIARAVPGVAGLHSGMFGEVATYLPGRRVTGVRVHADQIDVHISVRGDTGIRQTAAAVRAAVAAAVPGHRVDVTVADLVPESPTDNHSTRRTS
ncbi:Asp23/Gls24 family envelope stress response protein [Mycolicibacterium tokaiense]|uniref:Protein of uncharacterized function (DUF322) n=1 Tax=Mycolicibacterium tokaiense TaxID=39695 RepID=A0A378TF53_9MYCO|nr:Asp23/Gls24 family envelope stress response protein [Mycolicibacterium tokaiense]BBY86229.1 hypothetical protein MTOK_20110 [Mycolicibacterium tokaiense]STZ59260.1 Protein of uncharacterised function (DUF322) [Mycolicibacterium tokaiense]